MTGYLLQLGRSYAQARKPGQKRMPQIMEAERGSVGIGCDLVAQRIPLHGASEIAAIERAAANPSKDMRASDLASRVEPRLEVSENWHVTKPPAFRGPGLEPTAAVRGEGAPNGDETARSVYVLPAQSDQLTEA